MSEIPNLPLRNPPLNGIAALVADSSGEASAGKRLAAAFSQVFAGLSPAAPADETPVETADEPATDVTVDASQAARQDEAHDLADADVNGPVVPPTDHTRAAKRADISALPTAQAALSHQPDLASVTPGKISGQSTSAQIAGPAPDTLRTPDPTALHLRASTDPGRSVTDLDRSALPIGRGAGAPTTENPVSVRMHHSSPGRTGGRMGQPDPDGPTRAGPPVHGPGTAALSLRQLSVLPAPRSGTISSAVSDTVHPPPAGAELRRPAPSGPAVTAPLPAPATWGQLPVGQTSSGAPNSLKRSSPAPVTTQTGLSPPAGPGKASASPASSGFGGAPTAPPGTPNAQGAAPGLIGGSQTGPGPLPFPPASGNTASETQGRRDTRAYRNAPVVQTPGQTSPSFAAQMGLSAPAPSAIAQRSGLSANSDTKLEEGHGLAPTGTTALRDIGPLLSDPPAAPARGLAETARHIASQIAALGAPRPGAPIELRLNPEELGLVRLSLSPGENSMMVSLQAERGDVLDLMRRHIDILAQEFRALGYSDLQFSFGTSAHGNAEPDTSDEPETGDLPAHSDDSASPQTPAIARASGSLDLRL